MSMHLNQLQHSIHCHVHSRDFWKPEDCVGLQNCGVVWLVDVYVVTELCSAVLSQGLRLKSPSWGMPCPRTYSGWLWDRSWTGLCYHCLLAWAAVFLASDLLSRVMGLTVWLLAGSLLGNNSVHGPVPLSPSSIIWYRPWGGWCSVTLER